MWKYLRGKKETRKFFSVGDNDYLGHSFNSKHGKGILTEYIVGSGFFAPQSTIRAGSQSHGIRGPPPPGRTADT